MRFALSPEQEQLSRIARQFLAEVPGPRSAADATTWRRMVEEHGWTALAIPERYGGFGFGAVELGIVLEELGRALVPSPLLGASLAAAAVLEAGSEEQKRALLPEFASGATGAFAVAGEPLVADAVGARWIVVQAEDRRGILVDGATATPVPSLDPTLALARIASAGAGEPLPGRLDGALERGWAMLAALAVGGAEATLDMAVSYAKVRTQFGRPIGSFQAIKHKCADMLVRLEAARSAALYAAWAIDVDAPDRALACRTAKAWCTDAFFRCAAENIQIHGGIGFTWEHDAHLYFARAKALQLLLGHPREHRAAVADAIV